LAENLAASDARSHPPTGGCKGSTSGLEIGAGFPPFLSHEEQETRSAEAVDLSSELRVAFGRFVKLLRRNHGLSIEELAEKAEIDEIELINIEEDVRHSPEPRSVYQLARCFRLPQKQLMQLAGLAQARDPRLAREAVRFAARSESTAKLSETERAALEAFIALLSRME
jgi:transcriptional regulator with XRE-family HTH domain